MYSSTGLAGCACAGPQKSNAARNAYLISPLLNTAFQSARRGFASLACSNGRRPQGEHQMLRRLREFLQDLIDGLRGLAKGVLLAAAVAATIGYVLYRNPPLKTVARGEVGIRINRLSGDVSESRDGSVLVFPGLHELRILSLRDQVYRPAESMRADGPSPFQSVEGLSLGVDVAVRYALDPARLRALAANLPDNYSGEIVEPAVQGVAYKTFARYTVREIFSTRRAEIQQSIEAELRTRLANDGIALRGVVIGKVDLPADYKRGMEALLAEELASEKMRYTLELKEKRVKESELDAEAVRVRREKAAEAAAQEQVIAAQMEREGALVSRHPLLIQKALADKLSDKIQVIIAPPPADHGFIGATLLGAQKQ